MCDCEKLIERLDALILRIAALEGKNAAHLKTSLDLVRIASKNDESLRIANEQLQRVLESGVVTARSTPKASQ